MNSVQIGIIFICLIRVNPILKWVWVTFHNTKTKLISSRNEKKKTTVKEMFEMSTSVRVFSKRIVFVAFCLQLERKKEEEKEKNGLTGKQTKKKKTKRHSKKRESQKTKEDCWKWITKASHSSQQLKKEKHYKSPLRYFGTKEILPKQKRRWILRCESNQCVLAAMNECVFDFTVFFVGTSALSINPKKRTRARQGEGKQDYIHLWLMQNKCRILHSIADCKGGLNLRRSLFFRFVFIRFTQNCTNGLKDNVIYERGKWFLSLSFSHRLTLSNLLSLTMMYSNHNYVRYWIWPINGNNIW